MLQKRRRRWRRRLRAGPATWEKKKKNSERISELVVLAADSSLFRAVVSSGCVYGLSCGACAIPLEALSLQPVHETREWGVQQCTERGVQSGA